jgi:hypothetical protein
MNRSASAIFVSLIACVVLLMSSSAVVGQSPRNADAAASPVAPANTITVTTTADAGPGSLRQALIDAAAGDIITFDTSVFPPGSPATIALQSELPYISRGNITLDASNAGVVLDGQSIPPGYYRCLVVTSSGNTIRGFQIINCRFDGILLANASNNVIGGDRAVGSGPLGQGNLISATGGQGIQIYADSRNNRVSGNLIGTDLTGTFARPNYFDGIALQGSPGPSGNILGGATPGERNVISGNGQSGIWLRDGAHHNTILGNYIGTNVSGSAAIGNRGMGVSMNGGASLNRIGGPGAGERNIISYNGGTGVQVSGSNTVSNTVQGNWIGVDADGTGGLDPRDLVVAGDGTVFLASYGRGVFVSIDGAGSWQAANSGLATTKIETLAVSPDYAADGTAWAWGEGQLYITTDRGAHWSAQSSALAAGLRSLAVSPNYAADRTLLAAVAGQGIYRSADGGVTWTKVYVTMEADNIAFSPGFATDRLVLAGLSWWGVRRSADGGVTWADSSAGLNNVPVYDMAFAADGQTVLLASHKCGNDGVYRSQDGGQTWSASSSGISDCGPEWQIALSPNFLTDGVSLAAEDSLYRSTDGGHIWARASGTFGSRGLALAFSPAFASDKVAYFANFAGIHKSTDGGAQWSWAGANLADQGNAGPGVQVCCGAGSTQILSNVIGGNAGQGISIQGTEAAGSLIHGNLVGLGPDGATRAANGSTNIWIETPYVTITDNTSAAGSHGGLRSAQSAHHLTIEDNRFGTDATGTYAIGNSYDGVTLQSSWDILRRNVASGNLGAQQFQTSGVRAGGEGLRPASWSGKAGGSRRRWG